jgi:branched-chain amino acid transport system substrate-binding protein
MWSSLIVRLSAAAMACAIVGVAPQSAVAAPVPVKIAVAAPLTAGQTALGHAMERGAQLAVWDYASELASAGAGVTMTVSAQDDQGSLAAAVTAANTIIGDSTILGVVGHVNPACSVSASKIYNTVDLAMVTPMSTTPDLNPQGLNNVFRACGIDTGMGTLAADVATKNLRLKRAYIVDDSTQYGRRSLADRFGSRFIANGGKVVGRAHTSRTQVNFRTLAAKIKSKKPSVVYYGGSSKSGAYLLRRLRRIGVKCQYIGSGLRDSAFVGTAGTQAEGVLSTEVGQPNDQLSAGVAYESRFAAAYPGVESIDGADAYAYDAAVAIIKAVIAVAKTSGVGELTGTSGRELVRARVAASDFRGVTGRVRFKASGDRMDTQYSARRVKSGAWLPTAVIATPGVSKSYEARHVDVLANLTPRLSTDSRTVKLLFYRKNSKGKFVLNKSVIAAIADRNSSSCIYEAFSIRLAKGSYHVFARQSGAGLASMDSPSKYFSVK